MKLVKENETWSRSFGPNGSESSEQLTGRQFLVVDNDGRVVGNATVNQTNAYVNIHNLSGFSTVEEGEAKLKELFGITD